MPPQLIASPRREAGVDGLELSVMTLKSGAADDGSIQAVAGATVSGRWPSIARLHGGAPAAKKPAELEDYCRQVLLYLPLFRKEVIIHSPPQ